MTGERQRDTGNRAILLLLLILATYLVAVVAGGPQWASGTIAAMSQQAPHVPQDAGTAPAACPPTWMILPFALLLATIAAMPLIPGAAHWWHSNLHKLCVAGGPSLLVLVYYLAVYH